MNVTVIKIGGNDLADAQFVQQVSTTITQLQQEKPCVIVHGGGAAISNMLERLGIAPQFNANGHRITDDATMEVVEAVLSGRVNKQLVTALLDAGLDAIGLSGVDRGLMRAEPFAEDMGRVGRIVKVRAEVITDLTKRNIVPVIAPPSNGESGRFNINADVAAGAIGGALRAERVIFVTNVSGVKANGAIIPELTAGEVNNLIADGTIYGGMIPKTEAALAALAQGARSAVITNIDGLSAGTGTVLINEEN